MSLIADLVYSAMARKSGANVLGDIDRMRYSPRPNSSSRNGDLTPFGVGPRNANRCASLVYVSGKGAPPIQTARGVYCSKLSLETIC